MKLNLGCGKNWKKYPEFEGVDIIDFGQKYVLDIAEQGLLGIPDKSVEEIKAHNILEHIPPEREIFVMNECNRVLTDDGRFDIEVPKFPHDQSVVDPTHRTFWTRKKFTDYYAGGKPRNAKYYDHQGTEMKKWQVASKGDDYEMVIGRQYIRIVLMK